MPFFVNAPDENLVAWFEAGLLKPGRALELGCGAGRNAIHLAKQGCDVVAVDVSDESVRWAQERADKAGCEIDFRCQSVVELELEDGSFDLAYEAGLLHHLPPHRRPGYLECISRVLKPHARFGMVCFNTLGGPAIADHEVYERREMPWGIGYDEDRLRAILEPHFRILELRTMRPMDKDAECFGVDFCWTILMEQMA